MDKYDITTLAVKHGVEDPLNDRNAMRYRRLESMVDEILANQPPSVPARQDGDGVAGD